LEFSLSVSLIDSESPLDLSLINLSSLGSAADVRITVSAVQGHSWRIPLIFDLAVGVDSITQLPFPFGSQVSTPTSHTTPHSPRCVPMAPLTSRIQFHATALALSSWEPAAAGGAVIELTRRKLLTLNTGHTLVVISVACSPSPRLPLSSLHERSEAVWLTLLFHSDPSPRNSIPSTHQRSLRRNEDCYCC
jgi:hypothetical protein